MSDRSRQKRPAAAGALLRELLDRRGLADRLDDYRAWLVWDEVVGPQIAARARPLRLRDGILEVRVDQPVWMQQLQLMKPQILTRIHQRLGSDSIRDIFLRRGRIDPAVNAPSSPPLPPPVPLTDEEQKEVEATVAQIPDPELRRSLASLLVRQKQLDNRRKS